VRNHVDVRHDEAGDTPLNAVQVHYDAEAELYVGCLSVIDRRLPELGDLKVVFNLLTETVLLKPFSQVVNRELNQDKSRNEEERAEVHNKVSGAVVKVDELGSTVLARAFSIKAADGSSFRDAEPGWIKVVSW
jgi:hypothetical protein